MRCFCASRIAAHVQEPRWNMLGTKKVQGTKSLQEIFTIYISVWYTQAAVQSIYPWSYNTGAKARNPFFLQQAPSSLPTHASFHRHSTPYQATHAVSRCYHTTYERDRNGVWLLVSLIETVLTSTELPGPYMLTSYNMCDRGSFSSMMAENRNMR